MSTGGPADRCTCRFLSRRSGQWLPPAGPRSGRTSLAGSNTIYLYTQDHAGASSGYQARGNYTLSFPAQQPAVVSGTPTSGSGNAQAFTITYSDPLGNANLNSIQLLIGATTSGLNACYV